MGFQRQPTSPAPDSAGAGRALPAPKAGVVHSPVLTLTTAQMVAGDHRLTLEITGANPEAAKAYMAGVDYVYLKRVP